MDNANGDRMFEEGSRASGESSTDRVSGLRRVATPYLGSINDKVTEL
jgi:hypothetical protein